MPADAAPEPIEIEPDAPSDDTPELSDKKYLEIDESGLNFVDVWASGREEREACPPRCRARCAIIGQTKDDVVPVNDHYYVDRCRRTPRKGARRRHSRNFCRQ